MTLSSSEQKRALVRLALFHIFIIASSNYLVQLPITIAGFHTTWGAFSFPFIFLATDLTVRLFGAGLARKIIQTVMLPALVVSYLLSVLFFEGAFQGVAQLASFNLFVARIALASFLAYLIGQVMDVQVFNRLRQMQTWWIAPAASTLIGNLIDTLAFFSIAFYQSTDPFMAEHWVEIATVDYFFKLVISLGLFVPLYGVLLRYLSQKLVGREHSALTLSDA
ncbi:MAG: 7-cyano-7-deazaguanine/7-aminomethyl-7-deazaguanine transporter [Aeromonas sp.]